MSFYVGACLLLPVNVSGTINNGMIICFLAFCLCTPPHSIRKETLKQDVSRKVVLL